MTTDITTLGVVIDSSQIKTANVSLDDLANSATKTESATASLSKATDILSRVYRDLAVAAVSYKAYEYIKEATLLAARYETLGVSMKVVGQNAGYTAAQMEAAALGMQMTGISMIESRQQAMRLVQAHIDLADSQKLARIAQDAAVIGNMNSSEAFAAMIHGISTGQPEVLRTIGLNVSMEQSYKTYAETLHKTAQQLTQNEKTQALLNAAIGAGAGIAGTYEAAMDTASKQINSMERYTKDLKTMQGQVFNEVLTTAVMAYTAHLKDANAEMKSMSANGELKAWGMELAGTFSTVGNILDNMFTKVRQLGTTAAHNGRLTDITDSYQTKINNQTMGPFGSEDRKKLENELKNALNNEMLFYEKTITELDTKFDRVYRAWDERQKALADRDAANKANSLAREGVYQYAIDSFRDAYVRKEMTKDQYVKAVTGATNGMYGDNHKYGDTAVVNTSAVSAAAKALSFYNDLMDESSGYTKSYAEDQQKLALAFKNHTIPTYEKYVAAVEKLMDSQPIVKARRKEEQDGLDELFKTIDANEKVRQSWENSKVAAEQYLATIGKQAERTIGGIGMGNSYRQNQSGLGAIEDKLSSKYSSLATDQRDEKITQATYLKELGLAQETYEAEVSIYKKTRDEIRAYQGDWTNGMSEALNNYLDGIDNVAAQTESLMTSSFKSMEDSLTSFVMTGKLSFDSLVETVISGTVRMAIQQSIMKPLASMFGFNLLANGGVYDGGLQKFANGGTFTNQIVNSPTLFKFANGTGMMGEAGPEAIMPLTRGSDGKLGVQASGSSQQPNITINITANMADIASKADVVAGMRATANQITAQIQRNMQYGGAMA